MKWKFNEYEKPPELSSDIEWMLQSGQVSRIYFLEALAESYYPSILHLTTTLLNDKDAAREATRSIFLKAVLNVHSYRSQIGVEIWLFKIAYQMILQIQRRENVWRGIEKVFSINGELTSSASTQPESVLDEALWKVIDGMPDLERKILLLEYANGLNADTTSAVTGLSLAQVTGLHNQAMLHLLKTGPGTGENLEKMLIQSLERRWPLAQPTLEEIQAYARSIEGKAGRGHSLQRGMTTMKEVAIIGLAILIVFLMIWGGNRFFLRADEGPAREGSSLSGEQKLPSRSGPSTEKQLSSKGPTPTGYRWNSQGGGQYPQATPTPTGVYYYVQEGDTLAGISSQFGVSPDDLAGFNRIAPGAILEPGLGLVIPGSLPEGRQLKATPVSTATRLDPSTRPETSEEVLHLLNPESFPFNTIWLDAVVMSIRPGDPNYMDFRSRFQVWLSPQQFLILGGAYGREPEEVGIGFGGRFYVAKPGEGQSFFKDLTSDYERPPMSVPLFFGLLMLLGDSDDLGTSKFTLLGESEIAGRETWVVSQSKEEGDPQALLWLDKETGFRLRFQNLGSPGYIRNAGEFWPSEVVVRSVAYDVDFPQELFDFNYPWRGGYVRDHTGEPATASDRPFPAQENTAREVVEKPLPPENFDPTKSRLSFRYPIEPSSSLRLANTDVYADGYFIGRLQMGIPWNAICRRSQEGSFLVFRAIANRPGAAAPPSSGYYYVNLMNLDKVYRLQPAELGMDQDFAISPNSHTVAVWGCSGKDDACGIYLHDMETHKWRMLAYSEEGASSFTWSPDGKSLAWLNAGNVVIVMDVDSGKITYTGDYEALDQSASAESPIKDWGVTFPPSRVGLEGCILPPYE